MSRLTDDKKSKQKGEHSSSELAQTKSLTIHDKYEIRCVCVFFPLPLKFTSHCVFPTAEMSFGAACIFLRGGKNIVSTAATGLLLMGACPCQCAREWVHGFMQSPQHFVSAPNVYFCTTLKINIWVFSFVQPRQLADDEIDGELNSLHIPLFLFHLFSRLSPCSAFPSTCTATL